MPGHENAVFTHGSDAALRGAPSLQHWLGQLANRLSQGQPQVLVTVGHTLGSTPRDTGARMWVSREGFVDTVGGGHLEWKAIAHARAMLDAGKPRRDVVRYPLGPSLGQCCGGVVWLVFELLDRDDAHWCVRIAELLARGISVRRTGTVVEPLAGNAEGSILDIETGVMQDVWMAAQSHVVVCGAGHIGQAIVRLLADLPVRVTWLDPRDGCWPDRLPDNVTALHGDADDVPDLPENAYWLILTHNHALDLQIIDAVFRKRSFAFIGLIGSHTKKARFVSRLRQRHDPVLVERLQCPVGLVNTSSKLPAVIAVSVVAQLLGAMSA